MRTVLLLTMFMLAACAEESFDGNNTSHREPAVQENPLPPIGNPNPRDPTNPQNPDPGNPGTFPEDPDTGLPIDPLKFFKDNDLDWSGGMLRGYHIGDSGKINTKCWLRVHTKIARPTVGVELTFHVHDAPTSFGVRVYHCGINNEIPAFANAHRVLIRNQQNPSQERELFKLAGPTSLWDRFKNKLQVMTYEDSPERVTLNPGTYAILIRGATNPANDDIDNFITKAVLKDPTGGRVELDKANYLFKF